MRKTEALKVLHRWSLLLKCTLFRTNHCSCPKSCLRPPEICSDAENKSSFGDFLLLQMLNLIRKEKVILRGLGKKGGGGAQRQLLQEREQTGMEHYSWMPKGETKTQKHFRAATLGKVCILFVRCCCGWWISVHLFLSKKITFHPYILGSPH